MLLALTWLALLARLTHSKDVDAPYIGCEVCRKVAEAAHHQVNLAKEKAPYKKISEEDIELILSSICNPEEEAGEWIKRQDIVEKKVGKEKFLVLDTPGGVQKCNQECKSIKKSCEDLFDEDLDVEAFSVFLYKHKGDVAALQEAACTKMSKRCKKTKPLPAKFKREDKPFTALSEKDLELEKIMATMKANGLSGNMYDADTMREMMERGEYPGDDMFGGMDPYGMDGYGDMGDFGGFDGATTSAGKDDFEL